MIAEDPISLLDKKLQTRGIWQAAQDLDWRISGSGWRYPVYDADGKPYITRDGRSLYRFKNQDSNATPKYAWEPKETDRPTYYEIPDAHKAIADAGGEVYLASGEPDVLAFCATGMRNVLCWFGEQSVPATLASDLKARGVIAAYCYPDLDKTGTSWATKIATALQDSGIQLHVGQLSAELGDKGDINKLWQVCKFNADDFAARLVSLPELDVKPEPHKAKVLQLPDSSEPPPGLWEEIERHAGVAKYNDKGWSDQRKCPFNPNHLHDDKQPAFALSKATWSSKCPKCAQTWGWKATAEALSIRWQDYTQKPTYDVRQAVPYASTAALPAASRFTPKRLSDLRNAPIVPNLTAEIPAHSLGAIFGPSGGYKTAYALNYQILPMARDGNPVVLVEGEGDDRGTYERIAAWCDHHKVDQATIESNLLIFSEPVYLMQPADVAALIAAIHKFAPALVVIDTLAVSALGADENSSRDVGIMLDACRRIIRETGATVALIHHTGKNGASERGSSALRAQCDWMIELASDDQTITVSCSKSRNSKPFDAYHLRAIDCGSAQVLIGASRVVQTTDDRLTQRQVKALEALALETFADAGAKATQIADIAHIPTDSIFRILSALKRLDYVKQSAKGDPYYITATGRARLSPNKASDTAQLAVLADNLRGLTTSSTQQLTTLASPFRDASDVSSDSRLQFGSLQSDQKALDNLKRIQGNGKEV